MAYGQAMLGESVELYNEAVEWGKEQLKMLEKKEKARANILADLAPMIEEKKKNVKNSRRQLNDSNAERICNIRKTNKCSQNYGQIVHFVVA